MEDLKIHTIEEIQTARKKLGDKVLHTPVWPWKGDKKDEIFGKDTELFLKLELFQFGGSFKARGTLMNMFDLSDEQ